MISNLGSKLPIALFNKLSIPVKIRMGDFAFTEKQNVLCGVP